MASSDRGARVADGPWWVLFVLGGVAMSALFVPFTLAHGPTSNNEEHLIAGWSMHGWGLLMGTVPNLLIAAGLWVLRRRLDGDWRGVRVATAVVAGALVLDAVGNLAFRALGAPFVLWILVPATVVAALLLRPADCGGPVRTVVIALAVALAAGLALTLVPQQASDSIGGFRWFGIVTYGLVGLLWAALGLALRAAGRRVATTAGGASA